MISSKAINCILISVIIQMLFYLGNDIYVLKYLGLIVVLIAALMLDTNSLFYIYFASLPNQRLLVLDINASSILNLILISIFLKNIFAIKINFHLLYICTLFVAYTLVPIYFGGSSLVAVGQPIKIVIIFFILYNELNKFKIRVAENYIYSFILGVLLMGLLGMIFVPITESNIYSRFSAGDQNNPNDYSILLVVSLSYVLIINRYIYKSSMLLYGLILVNLYFGILTQSRTYLLGVFILFLAMLFLNNEKISIKRILYIIIFILMLFIFYILYKEMLVISFTRVIDPRRGDISGSRFFIWLQFLDFFSSNLFYLVFGLNSNLTILNSAGIYNVAHNSFLELITYYGIIGSIIVITMYLFIYRLQVSNHLNYLSSKTTRYIMLPLFIQLLLSMTRHVPLDLSFISQYFLSLFLIKIVHTKIHEFSNGKRSLYVT